MLYCHHWEVITMITIKKNLQGEDFPHSALVQCPTWATMHAFQLVSGLSYRTSSRGCFSNMGHHTGIRNHLLPLFLLISLSQMLPLVTLTHLSWSVTSSLTLGLIGSHRVDWVFQPHDGAQDSALTNRSCSFPRLPLVSHGHVTPSGPMRASSTPCS